MKFIVCTLYFTFACFSAGCSLQSIANQYLMESLQSSQGMIKQSKNYQVVEKALPTFIVLLDSVVVKDPTNLPALIKGAELHVSYALSFIESQDTHWAGLHYQKAMEYSRRAIEIKYGIKTEEMIGKPEKEVEQMLAGMDIESVPYLFWWGMSWGLYINVNKDNIKAVGEFPYVRIIMEKVLSLDGSYQNGLPHLFFGVYYGTMTPALGGKPEESKKHFDHILDITKNEFLLAKVLCARTYCISIQNRKLFEELLKSVIEASDPNNLDFVLSNELAKKDAKALLKKIDEYFLPEATGKKEEELDSGL